MAIDDHISAEQLDAIMHDPKASREQRIEALFKNREVVAMLAKSRAKVAEPISDEMLVVPAQQQVKVAQAGRQIRQRRAAGD